MDLITHVSTSCLSLLIDNETWLVGPIFLPSKSQKDSLDNKM